MESRDSPGLLKQVKKGKCILIEASGSVSGQLFSASILKKSEKSLGVSSLVEEPKRSPTLLINIDDHPHKPDKEMYPHP